MDSPQNLGIAWEIYGNLKIFEICCQELRSKWVNQRAADERMMKALA
jgi:hypothetical protein